MDALEFLRRVLPQAGWYVCTVINSGSPPKQGFYETVEDLERAVSALDRTGNNTYFAVSAFTDKGNRKQENVRVSKAFYLDVDCGEDKPFVDWKAGLKALGDFVLKAKLPKPLVVASGRGLHVYWVLDRELPPSEWQPIADALKSATVALGFEADPAVTSDSARILRPVGTHNPKNGQEVRLLIDAEPVRPDDLKHALTTYHAANLTGAAPKRATTLLDNLAVKQEFPPANADVIEAKCNQIAWIVNNQKDVAEPLWYAMLGVAAHTTDPDQTAINWSKNHPGFDPVRTISKLQQWQARTTGPTMCSKLESLRPGGCKGCAFKDKIGTPVRLGVQYVEIEAPKSAPVDIDPAQILPMPKPFKRTESGIKITIDDTDVDICRFDLFPVSYGYDEGLGYEVVRFMWNRPHHGWRELLMRQAYLTDGHREFPTAIADQGIVLVNKKQTEFFQLMLRQYMEELRQVRTMTNLYSTMGWKEGNQMFVLGDKLMRRAPSGEVKTESVTMAGATKKLAADFYAQAGALGEWSNFTKVFDASQANLPYHMFCIGVALSAPLYHFTGLKGITISLFGPTGAGKTLAQYLMQSVWGDPEKLHFTAKFTQNALFARMALYNNLPFTVDEATMIQDKELGDFLYWVSQGRDKARLTKHSEEREAKTWGLPVVVSTNKSIASALYVAGLDADAQQARLLELTVPANRLFTKGTDAGRKIYDFVNSNYGHAGPAFLTHIMGLGEEKVREEIAKAINDFPAKYGRPFMGHERYWEQAIVLADYALEVGRSMGLIQFDHHPAIREVLNQIATTRKVLADNTVDAFDLIAEYLNDHGDSIVTVMHTNGQSSLMDQSVRLNGEIRARYDIFRQDVQSKFTHGTLLLDRRAFRQWLSQRGGDYKTFMDALNASGADATPLSRKAMLGKDTPFKLGQTYVVGVSLSHPRMKNALNNEDDNPLNATLGMLKAVV